MRISNMPATTVTKYISHNSNATNKNITQNTNSSCDTLSISKSGKNAFNNNSKMSNMLDSLLKQKQNIIESKNKLIERTMEKEKSLDSIKDQLAEYEDQIIAIDNQISSYMLEEKQKALGTDKKEETETNSKPKTEQEIQDKHLNNIVSLSNNVLQVQTCSAVKDKLDGQARVLSTEIKLDEARGQNTNTKREQLTEIKETIDNISKKVGETLSDTNEKIENNLINEKPDTSENSDESSNVFLDEKQNTPYTNKDIL